VAVFLLPKIAHDPLPYRLQRRRLRELEDERPHQGSEKHRRDQAETRQVS
jgi:hypothetical protein